MNHFEDATPEELRQLIDIVDAGGHRNWAWLEEWVAGGVPVFYNNKFGTVQATAKNVVRLYTDDASWQWWQ